MTFLAFLFENPGATLGWLCAGVAMFYAVRGVLGRAEARGEAGVATAAKNTAEAALVAMRAERDAHRDRADRESAARALAVADVDALRARLAAEAKPGDVRADLAAKFSGGGRG